jgi:hypothetical protein
MTQEQGPEEEVLTRNGPYIQHVECHKQSLHLAVNEHHSYWNWKDSSLLSLQRKGFSEPQLEEMHAPAFLAATGETTTVGLAPIDAHHAKRNVARNSHEVIAAESQAVGPLLVAMHTPEGVAIVLQARSED